MDYLYLANVNPQDSDRLRGGSLALSFEMLVDVYLQFIAWSPFTSMIQEILEM